MEQEKNKISVVIHTYNNENIIRACLESVKNFDEIVICDMHSTDKTLEIAKEYNAKIVFHENIGFVEPARNFAIQQASFEWVLIVDSDERIPEALHDYLYDFIQNEKQYSAIKIPRKNYYWKIFMEMTYPDYITRFARKSAIYWPDKVHSQPRIDGKIYTIGKNEKNLAFIHYTCDTPTKLVKVINKYTDCETDKLLLDNKKCNIYWRIFQSFTLIFEKFFIKGGWKNGIDGFILCVFFGFYKFLMYVKYYELLKNNKE